MISQVSLHRMFSFATRITHHPLATQIPACLHVLIGEDPVLTQKLVRFNYILISLYYKECKLIYFFSQPPVCKACLPPITVGTP